MTRKCYSLEPIMTGGAILSDGSDILCEIPPHMCVKWAAKLLEASRLGEMKINAENVKYLPLEKSQ